jgi:hypothetical protein
MKPPEPHRDRPCVRAVGRFALRRSQPSDTTRILKAKRIYVESLGDDSLNKTLQAMLIDALTLFFGGDQGGKTAAVLRSFTASCQRVGVEPFAWFKDVLSRIATHPITRIAELLPHNWKPVQA